MASRLDLEARLRALRTPSARAAPSAAAAPPAPVPQHHSPAALTLESLPVAPVADAATGVWLCDWPEPPIAKPRRASSARVPTLASGGAASVHRRSSISSNNSSSSHHSRSRDSNNQQQPQPPPPLPPAPTAATPTTTPASVSVASLLGPAYSDAIHLAQYAIESERSRNVHTAIDAYIRAGQQLITIGRQQHIEHLQTIVKKKALALLERAEGLSDWVANAVSNASDALAVDAAFAASQQAHDATLDAKEALVAQLKSENDAMTNQLHQLVVLTKVRARFRRVLRERRARKAAEAELQQQEVPLSTKSTLTNTSTAIESESESESEPPQQQQLLSTNSPSAAAAATDAADRAEQKRVLVNELHARIGLPEISALRRFTPLSSDAMRDQRHVELEDELDAAKREAARLRAAVHEIEDAFHATIEQTRQQSLKLSQKSDRDKGALRDELARVRNELERERSLKSLARATGQSDNNNNDDDDDENDEDDPDAFEDVAMIQTLRQSLHAMIATSDEKTMKKKEEEEDDDVGAAALSPAESESDAISDVDDDDGGVWL